VCLTLLAMMLVLLILSLSCAKQVDELNVYPNSVIRKVFGYHKWESVSAVLLGIGID